MGHDLRNADPELGAGRCPLRCCRTGLSFVGSLGKRSGSFPSEQISERVSL